MKPYQLYRALYIREGRLRGMTFAARNPALAALYAYGTIESLLKTLNPPCEILDIVPAKPPRPRSSLY